MQGFVLGLQKIKYHCGEIAKSNDLVLYYTDGVIDTSNSYERFDEERLIKTFTKLCNIPIHLKN